jgi:hypothetical protein
MVMKQAIDEGTKRSKGVFVSPSPTAIEPGLKTFTIVDWTSSTRQITNPYTLIFTLRTDDGVISPDDAKTVWHGILQKTLKGEDLKKLGAGDSAWTSAGRRCLLPVYRSHPIAHARWGALRGWPLTPFLTALGGNQKQGGRLRLSEALL